MLLWKVLLCKHWAALGQLWQTCYEKCSFAKPYPSVCTTLSGEGQNNHPKYTLLRMTNISLLPYKISVHSLSSAFYGATYPVWVLCTTGHCMLGCIFAFLCFSVAQLEPGHTEALPNPLKLSKYATNQASTAVKRREKKKKPHS